MRCGKIRSPTANSDSVRGAPSDAVSPTPTMWVTMFGNTGVSFSGAAIVPP